MLKEKLFKLLFPGVAKSTYFNTQRFNSESKQYIQTIKRLREKLDKRDSYRFGFNSDLHRINEEGEPPHYLKDLSEVERTNYVADLESIYTNKKFMPVLDYCINLIGNKTLHVLDEDKMKYGRYMILGIKKVINELEEAHKEFVRNNTKKEEEKFDPLAPLPE